MPDDADWAADIAERERAELIAARRFRPATGGSSGVCIECGEPIEPARPAVLPHARKCAHCAGARPHE